MTYAPDEPRWMYQECEGCEGAGWYAGGVHGYDPHDGSPQYETYTCECCNGTGQEVVERVLIDEEDL